MAQHIYLETAPGSNKFKYRGEAGPADDPRSFKEKMEANGSGPRVEIRDQFAGLEWTEYVPLSLSQADLDAISEAIWSRVIDTLDAEEVMKVLLSAMAGKVSGAETGTIRFRDIADTKDRIVAEVDGNGNRTSVALDVT